MTHHEAVKRSWVVIREWQQGGATSAERLARLIQAALLEAAGGGAP